MTRVGRSDIDSIDILPPKQEVQQRVIYVTQCATIMKRTGLP